jgi:hypothetical protein
MVLGPGDLPNLLINQCKEWNWVQALRSADEARKWYGLGKTRISAPENPGLIQSVVVEDKLVFVQVASFPNNSTACTFADAMGDLMESRGEEIVGSDECPGDRCWLGSYHSNTAISACVGSTAFVVTKVGRESDPKAIVELCSRLAKILAAKATEGQPDRGGAQ